MNKLVSRSIIIFIFIIIICIGALPNYLGNNNWSWKKVPSITAINQIKKLRKTGLIIPGWEIDRQNEVKIGGHKWSAQLMNKPGQKPIILFLLPQNHHTDKPEVEWVDIKGFSGWKTDSFRKLNLAIEKENIKIKARFFRAWNPKQTFAVLQWYAFPQGGHYAPSKWFWSDQIAQLHRHRIPWVAVCLQIPIKPLGNISTAQPLAESLSKTIQTALKQTFSTTEEKVNQ